MTSITIQLSDRTARRLEHAAKELGLSSEKLIEKTLEEKLDRLGGDFDRAANRVLEKNEELYRRLA